MAAAAILVMEILEVLVARMALEGVREGRRENMSSLRAIISWGFATGLVSLAFGGGLYIGHRGGGYGNGLDHEVGF